MAEHRELASSH